MPRDSRLKAESQARAVLSAAIADYRGDVFTRINPAPEERVLAALKALAERIELERRRNLEAMKIARSFARLAHRHPRLVELLVACLEIHDRSGEIERSVDIGPLLADLQNPSRWSSSHRALFAAYDAEQERAFRAAFRAHGPREALAIFVRVLTARGRCRPTDLARVAGLVLSDTRIRLARMRPFNIVIERPRRKAVPSIARRV
jgi:hypothetical protein